MLGYGVVVLAQWSAWWELVTLSGWRGHEGVWEISLFLEGDPSSQDRLSPLSLTPIRWHRVTKRPAELLPLLCFHLFILGSISLRALMLL